MPFNPKELKVTVYEQYKKGHSNWLFTLDCAVQCGIRDVNTLTNIAFYLHHPELNYRSLTSDESLLIAEWKSFRTIALLRLGRSASASGNSQSQLINATKQM
ncbi:MAG TPA: hypothetical protein PKA82_00985 [Pyrinomonadaceae bacterium]|nr:hypothetical protein [Pyrinomonadaceae bacterium]